jgi:hypothetical protein
MQCNFCCLKGEVMYILQSKIGGFHGDAYVVPSSLILSILVMEMIHSSETLVFARATWHQIPEGGILCTSQTSLSQFSITFL